MTRPSIIRADTIDLQDPDSPSAQDHTRQPAHPAAIGVGPPAPHQAETLREVAAEEFEEQHRSPRLSVDWADAENIGHSYPEGSESALNGDHDRQDALAVAQNGGQTGTSAEDAEMADAEGNDDLDDDDMMDKISSSPSIDDGPYTLPQMWPARLDPLSPTTPKSSSFFHEEPDSDLSSPFLDTPEHLPVLMGSQQTVKQANLEETRQVSHSISIRLSRSSPASRASSLYEDERRDTLSPLPSDRRSEHVENYDNDFEVYDADEPFAVQKDLDPDFEDVDDNDGPMFIPYESSEDEDDYEFPVPEESRFIDSGWGGECLQDAEDIDFEFVYALHTFVATVEGQANATKGDTMVLLDDSNSYWWLVRVVKDSSIGYLPAEHIETPTERLARLNKHRNIDLSAAMLGDQAEKSKNPLKKAIRRRNAKTVTFSAPTYVEASDVDYSSDEEDAEGKYYTQEQQAEAQQHAPEEDEIVAAEPVAQRSEVREVKPTVSDPAAREVGDGANGSSETSRTSDEIFDNKTDGPAKSRNGTVRNTDSFFKDDTVETRKITITPNLLRDDSSTSTRTSNDSKELRQRPSLDKFEPVSPERNKDDRKKKDKKDKEKKPGMLSGLFKRKDKKEKPLQKEEIDEIIYGKKASTEDARSSPVPSKDSEDFASVEDPSRALASSPQRQPSKLQKQRADGTTLKPSLLAAETPAESQQLPAPERAPTAASAAEPSMRIVQPEVPQEIAMQMQTQAQAQAQAQQGRVRTPELSRTAPMHQTSQDDLKSGGSAFSKILRSRSGGTEGRPEKLKQAKQRLELDDSDTSVEVSPVERPAPVSRLQSAARPIPGAFPDSYIATPAQEKDEPNAERLSESPVEVSPVSKSHPPALMVDTSSQEEQSSPISSPSPELINADEAREKVGSTTGGSTPTSSTTWSDAHLRTFFDDDSDIKDLLVVVYDKSGVVPAGPDHPITGNLFKEENAKLADITNRLDGMLGDWLARKSRTAVR